MPNYWKNVVGAYINYKIREFSSTRQKKKKKEIRKTKQDKKYSKQFHFL